MTYQFTFGWRKGRGGWGGGEEVGVVREGGGLVWCAQLINARTIDISHKEVKESMTILPRINEVHKQGLLSMTTNAYQRYKLQKFYQHQTAIWPLLPHSLNKLSILQTSLLISQLEEIDWLAKKKHQQCIKPKVLQQSMIT